MRQDSRIPQVRSVQLVLVAGVAGFLVGLAGILLAQDVRWIRIFDNLHWTAATLTAAALAWFGVRAAHAGDITERKQVEQQIRDLAYFDVLTQLPNRRMLMDRLGHALAASDRSQAYGALMILDLDHFKTLNDTQGHDVGDRLLVEVSRRLTANVRQQDSVCRLGGDEFVVLLEGLGADEAHAASQAEAIAEKVRFALNQPYALDIGGTTFHSTSSIGLALFRGQGASTEMLLKQADVALYQAQRDFLLANGCRAYQGLLFCRPIQIEEWASLLAPAA